MKQLGIQEKAHENRFWNYMSRRQGVWRVRAEEDPQRPVENTNMKEKRKSWYKKTVGKKEIVGDK